jgi:hypothetical protein
MKKRQKEQKSSRDHKSLVQRENFPEELVSLNKEILERRLSSNFGSLTSRAYGSTANLREPEVMSISARGKVAAQIKLEDAKKTCYNSNK